MKSLYIPKGKTLHYEALSCHDIVNDGVLEVEGTVQARNISGKGILKAGTISAKAVSAMSVDAAGIVVERLAVERVCAVSVRASSSLLASCCLEAEYVDTPKLLVARSEIGELRAGDVVNLPDRNRSILAALAAGFFRRLWLGLLHKFPKDAAYTPIPEKKPEAGETAARPADNLDQWRQSYMELLEDPEFLRLAGMYRVLRPTGYTLRLVDQAGREAAQTAA